MDIPTATIDPQQPVAILKSSHSTLGFSRARAEVRESWEQSGVFDY
jgi:hypothetical protein